MKIKIYVASAFSKDNSGGNKAGVLIEYYKLTNNQKMEIAKRLGYSETAFLSESKSGDFNIEYFTPKEEVPLCGHATIATFTVLNEFKLLNKDKYIIETKSGLLNVNIENDGTIFMEQNNPKYYDIIEKSTFKNCFDITSIDDSIQIQIVSTGLKDILVPIKTRELLDNLKPNFKVMSDISDRYNVIGVHAFCLENSDNKIATCRNFAPLYDIDEESATGTSNCALACYLYKNGIKKDKYVFEQGYNLNNPSQIIAKIITKDNEINKVYVGGKGYFVEEIIMDI